VPHLVPALTSLVAASLVATSGCNLVLEDSPGRIVEVQLTTEWPAPDTKGRWESLRLNLQEVALLPCLPVLGASSNARASSHGVSSSTRLVLHRWVDLLTEPVREDFILIPDGADYCAVRLTFGGHAQGSDDDRLSLVSAFYDDDDTLLEAHTSRAFDVRIPLDPQGPERVALTVALTPAAWLAAIDDAETETDRGAAMVDACAATTHWTSEP